MQLLGLKEERVIYEKKGCPFCSHTGYLGRIGVFEIMIINDEIRNMIMSDDFTSEKVAEIVERDMITVLGNTRERVLNGETTIEEYDSLVDIVKA